VRAVAIGAAVLLLAVASPPSSNGGPTPTAPAPDTAPKGAPPVMQNVELPAAAHDFDFLHGRWRVENEFLKKRLAGSADWDTFAATQEVAPILDGLGNIDEYVTERQGKKFIGVSLRLFSPKTNLWSIYWVDNFSAKLEDPVVGAFRDGVGTFISHDQHEGKPMLTRYLWSEITPKRARWEQALSLDDGTTWETNWVMKFTRAEG
jgi:hypothetical protein